MLRYTLRPRSFENIMNQFYNDEEIFFSSRTRRSRTFICLLFLSVAVIFFLITSIVFVTLYCLEQGTHSKPVASISSMNASATNHSTQCTLESQTRAGRKPSQSTTGPNLPARSTARTRTSQSTARPRTSQSTVGLKTTLNTTRTSLSTARTELSLSRARPNISLSTARPKTSLRLPRPKTPDIPTSLKPGQQLRYCGSKACLFASIGGRKFALQFWSVAYVVLYTLNNV